MLHGHETSTGFACRHQMCLPVVHECANYDAPESTVLAAGESLLEVATASTASPSSL